MIVQNKSGLSVEFLESGALKNILANGVRIGMKDATPYSLYGAGVYLRKLLPSVQYIPLTGPGSNGVFQVDKYGMTAQGSWEGLEYTCVFRLSGQGEGWQWDAMVTNTTGEPIVVDMVCAQDVGLKSHSSDLINAYYVSQYIERIILEDVKYGKIICCRQNMKESGCNPWLMMACRQGAASGLTDGMQFYGTSFREDGLPQALKADTLPGEYAGESSMVALQQKPFTLEPGKTQSGTFVFAFRADHPEASSEKDLSILSELIHNLGDDTSAVRMEWVEPTKSLFQTASLFAADELSGKETDHFFGQERFHPEILNGKLLSFFGPDTRHVVLKAKEALTDRPHGHIMQANIKLTPHEGIMSTNAFAYGVFNSHLSQGNTNFNIFLSVCSDPFNVERWTGQRIFVRTNEGVFLLGLPSAFEMGLNHCRWIYSRGNTCIQVRTWTNPHAPQVNTDVKLLSGSVEELIITHSFDPLNKWSVIPAENKGEYIALPASDSMIAGKFPGSQFRVVIHSEGKNYSVSSEEAVFSGVNAGQENSLFVIRVKTADQFCMSFVGEVHKDANVVPIADSDDQFDSDTREILRFWKNLSCDLAIEGNHNDIAAIRSILPWYGLNALTHYLTPYGLEQFGGAAWGTRDVSQGPIDLLLHLGKYNEARQLLRTIFSNQHPGGGWSQWWMFDSYALIRAHEAHGDIIYWCILALASYIRITGDIAILDEELPYFDEKGPTPEKTPVKEHMDRLINMIIESFVPGTALVPFGGGDWNDSLQPVSEELAQRMISSWTVEMNYQAFDHYRLIYARAGEKDKAGKLEEICKRIKEDFNRYLVKDGVVAGYGLVQSNNTISVLLHPSDETTGIHYSVLPMNRGVISGLFSPRQAELHQQLIEDHLKGPDGVRLMDRPVPYRGGIQKIFQRAESSTFFGREIGLMYIHEHIRYAEALAITGQAEAFVKALRQAIPVDYKHIVSCADHRQANCYYSSSDVIFNTRYQADEQYNEVLNGKYLLKGGWRVYSSGPGIFIGLVMTRLLGLRVYESNIVVDPVLPSSFDGLVATVELLNFPLRITYRIKKTGAGVKSLQINGEQIPFEQEINQYRTGGAVIARQKFYDFMNTGANNLEVIIH